MKISLITYLSQEVDFHFKTIQEINEKLKVYYATKDYGIGVNEILIGIVCFSPEFSDFYKFKKPRFYKKTSFIDGWGKQITVENLFDYKIFLDFETVKFGNENLIKRLVLNEIGKSFEIFDKKKLKNFDKEKFKQDYDIFIKSFAD